MGKFKSLSKGEMIGYGVGDLSLNLAFQTLTVFLLFFYTDVFGISAVAASALFLIARVWDAINDPIMGGIIDKTNTRWGKFRPYLLWGAIPYAIIFILCFTTPNFSYTGKLIYAYVTYIGMGMMHTVMVVPYGALTSSMTQDASERGSLSVIRMIFAMLGGLVVAGVPTITEKLGGGDLVKGYQLTAIIFAIIAIVFFFVCFSTTKERYSAKADKGKITIKSVIALLKSNRPLQIICLAFIIVFGNLAISGSVGMFYFKYNLNRPDLFSINMAVNLLFTIVALVFTPLLLKKGMEKKNIIIIGMIISIVKYLSYYTGSVPIILISAAIGSIGSGLMTGVIWGLVPDTVEYGEYKTGLRAEGITYSVVGFFFKLASALGGLVPGLVLEWTGYVPDAVQSSSALMGITTLAATIPIILTLLFVIVMRYYTLDSKTYNEIVQKLSMR